MSNRIITIRASSFGTFFDCALRFEAEQINRMAKRGSLRAWLGTSIHAGTAAYDQAIIDDVFMSVDEAAGIMVDMLWQPPETLERDEKLSLKEAERISLILLSRYCKEIAPGAEYAAVEGALKPLDIDYEGITLRFTGTMDRARVVRSLNGRVIRDIKSGGRLIDSDGKVIVKARAAQVGTYQLLDENTTGQLTCGAEIAALQTSSKPQVGVSHIFDAKALMLGDEARPGLIEIAAKMLKAGVFPPNPSSSLCSKKYCANWDRCAYHE
ncbi:MAG: PD-(D/E)XK nuclease family protein [Pseudomonadota bacterium]